MKFLITSICFVLVSNASDIEVFGTKTTVYNLKSSEVSYIINAKAYIFNSDAIRKEYNFFNRKVMAQIYHYRHDGDFRSQNINLTFEKAYQYDGDLVFENVLFKYKEDLLRAKECYYESKKLTCNKIKYFQGDDIIKTKLSKTFDSTSF